MSRGISQQQRQILGLGVGLSRLDNRRDVHSEINVAFVAVVLAGVPLIQTCAGLTGLSRSPAALTARTGIVRACASLVARGLLTRCLPPTSSNSRNSYGKLHGGNYQGSYALTDAGWAAGLPFEVEITKDMQQVLRSLQSPHWRYASWLITERYQPAVDPAPHSRQE